MDSPQNLARRIRKRTPNSREDPQGPIKATEPLTTNQRRYSEAIPQNARKPSSQSGRRASSGGSMGVSPPPSSSPQNNQLTRPLCSQSLDNVGLAERRALMLHRQNATTEEPDSQPENPNVFYNPHTPPRPPSQPRPKSAYGRPRSGSRSLSNKPTLQVAADISVTAALAQSQTTFSKYKPLPSIGTSGSSIDVNDQMCENDLSKKISTKFNISTKRRVPKEPPDEETHKIHLAVKLLDGTRHERWFQLSDTVDDILAFAESVSSEAFPGNCELCTNELPKRVFGDLSLTIEDIGLESRTVLYIQES